MANRVQSSSSRSVAFEIVRESLHFSAGHFTIFSSSERENLHGHNFQVQCRIECPVGEDGLAFDYGIVKDLLQRLCDTLDEKFLLPTRSPYLKISEEDKGVKATFNHEEMFFLKRDVFLLDVRNIAVEELANWFIDQLHNDPKFVELPINELTIRVASGSGQWGEASI